jgi:peroxiredoxin
MRSSAARGIHAGAPTAKSIIRAVALSPGTKFPRISLLDESGAPAAPADGETLYALFKTTCPVCELTWPFLERIRQVADGGKLAIVAVSQDNPAKTSAFNERTGTRLDTRYDPEPWKASVALGMTSVPTLFRVLPDGTIAETVEGFDRKALEGLARRAASLAGKPPGELFRPGDNVPNFKPG